MNVNVISPSGELVNIPQEQLQNAVTKFGYRPATSEEIQKDELKEQYGQSFGNELASGVEGALSGATFGLSRHLENKVGSGLLGYHALAGQEQALRKEYNPTASMVGEGVGIAGSLLLAPEVSLPGMLTKGAAKVGTKVAGSLLAEGAAQKIAGNIVAQGVEGLAYGASQPISESALGDPTLTAQKAFTQIGLGGLLGGAIGGTFSALGLGAKKLIPKGVSQEAEAIVGKGTSTLEGEAQTVAKEPLKMEGTIDFGMPDEKILKQAESLNPKNPLKQNDLNFIKQESPEVFKKIGTDEIPTYGTPKAGEVTGENAFMQDLEKFETKLSTQEEQAKGLISQSGLSIPIDEYQSFFEKQKEKLLGKFNTSEGRKAAVKAMDDYIERTTEEAKRLGTDTINAEDLRSNLQGLWDDNKRYFKMGLDKPSAEEMAISGVTKDINKYLKGKIQGYGDLMETYSGDMNLLKRINKQFRLQDGQPTISGWFENRVATPLEKVHLGNAADQNAKNMVEFSQAVGRDWPKINAVNRIYGRLNPEAATGSQRGTWTEVAREAFDTLRHPTEIPGKVLSGTAKIALTGEMPEFITKMRAKGIQDMLLGKTTNPKAVNSILSKFGDMSKKGSQFLDGPMSNLMVPAGVKLEQFVNDSDSIDHADKKLEVFMALEKAQKKSDQQLKTAVKGIFSDTPQKPDSTKDDFLSKTPKELSDSIQELRDQANELVNMPDQLMNRLDEANKGMDSAPDVVSALNMTAIRALNLIAQKMNADMPEGAKLPLDPKFVPNKAQLHSLAKTMKYINNPATILQDVSSGRVNKEGKDVLEQVYPELYNDMKAQVMGALSEAQAKGKKIPMAKQLAISYFLGQPLSSSMLPQNIAATQAIFAAPQSTPQQPNPTATNAKNLKMSQNMMTPLQKVASR